MMWIVNPTLGFQKDTTSKKKGVADEERDLQTYPERFNAHILQAQSWLRMKRANTAVSTHIPDVLKCLTFEHPDHGDILYEIYQEDATLLHNFVTKRPYTLLLVDIPYGFALPSCLHDDNVAWGPAELTSMIQGFKIVSTAKLWRIVILHNCEQLSIVEKVLKNECNGGIQNCCWYVTLHISNFWFMCS